MIAEFSHLLDKMDETIVPVGTDGLKTQLKNTLHFRMPRSGAVTAEWMDGDELRVEVGPMVDGLAEGEAYMRTSSWLHRLLPRRLNTWVEILQKDSLPRCLAGLTVLAGLDIENFLISGDDRGPCSICHDHACKQMTAFMFHIKLAAGVILISFEGWSKEELPRAVQPKCVPPGKTKCICITQCEIRKNTAVVEAMRVLTDVLWNEATSDVISVGFSAKKEERKQVNEVLSVLGIPPVGIRVVEASLFDEESVANAQFTKYVDNETDGEPLSRLNCQVAWLHDGKSWPGECWANPSIQHGFSLDRINKQERQHILYYVYNLVDEVGPLHLVWAGIIKFIVGSPLLLLGGHDQFIAELTDILLEVMARATTIDGDFFRARGILPTTVKEVFEKAASINGLPYRERNAKYKEGAYRLFNIDGSEFSFRPGLWFGSGLTNKREGPASQPLIAIGKKHKSKGFQLNDNQVALDIGGSGIKHIMDKDMANSMAGYEEGGGRGSIIPVQASRRDVDVPVRRDRSRSQEGPSRKKHAAEPERAEPQEDDGSQDNQILKEIIEDFPEIAHIVDMAAKMGNISKDNFSTLMVELQSRLKHVAGNKHVDVRVHDVKKSTFANNQPAEDQKKDQKRIDELEKSTKKRAEEITAIHNLQEKEKNELKALRSKYEVFTETETGKRKRVRESKVEDHKTRLSNACDAATMFVSFAKSKLVGSPDAILATVAVQNTLERQSGSASSEPVPRVLDGYNNMQAYDTVRSEVAMTSYVGDKIRTSRSFQEAVKKFETDKKKVGSGSLSGLGQSLKELEKVDSLGPASWLGTQIIMTFFRKMKKLRQRCHDEEVPKILSDEEIATAEKPGAMKAKNFETRARILVDDLVMAFDDATIAVTGRGLLETHLWYFDADFQEYYNKLLDEGIEVLKANGAAKDNDDGRSKFEAIVTSRQRPPLSDTDIARINSCFTAINSKVVVEEEYFEEDDSDMEDDREMPGRVVVEEDDDRRSRKAAHLDNYD